MVNPVSSSSSSSSSVASQYSGLMRVNGLASGMDIDGMVSQLMKAESVPLDGMKQKQQILEWQRDDYRSMYSSLQDLDTTIFNGITMQSTFNKKIVTSSNDSLVSATALTATNNVSTQISVGNVATSASWKSNGTINFAPGTNQTLSFSVTDPGATTPRNVTISISSTDQISDVIQKFNNSNLGVSAMMGTINGQANTIVLSNNQTGSGGSIVASDAATSAFMQNLGFTTDSNGNVAVDVAGNDASVTINGYSMTEKSNNFTINGINYTIKGQTSSPVSISTQTDVDSIFNAIKGFVDKYNSTISTINAKISETRDRDYPPLTDDQKASMTSDQITTWNNQAQMGMIANDPTLTSCLSSMRQNLYSPVTGNNVTPGFTQLSQIGITTSPDYTQNGALVIDEATLREKIQENPQAIYQLFNSDNSTSSGNDGTSSSEGLAKRMRDSISSASNQLLNVAGTTYYTDSQYTIGQQLTDLGTQITDFQSKLSDIENRYYSQFSAMEQAMEQSNQQSGYISSMLSSGG